MRLILLVGVAGFAARLLASDDPFAAYQNEVDSRLSAILVDHTTHPPAPATAPPAGQIVVSREGEIKAFAQRFWHGREAEFAAAFERLQILRPRLEPILVSEGVPKDLVAVVLVESGAQPMAISPREARGLWQFIPETARQYGLTVSIDKDERIQLEASTRAAARYLRDLYARFGDWPLALAAYNAGQQAVEDALRAGGPHLLPQETRGYVPAVLAAMELLDAKLEHHDHEDWIFAVSGID